MVDAVMNGCGNALLSADPTGPSQCVGFALQLIGGSQATNVWNGCSSSSSTDDIVNCVSTGLSPILGATTTNDVISQCIQDVVSDGSIASGGKCMYFGMQKQGGAR